MESGKGGEPMRRRIWTFMTVLIMVSFFVSGCCYFSAKKEIANAEGLFSELKAAGGERRVPYEYCSAEKFLEASKLEFSHSDFKPAEALAKRSKEAAQAGLSEVKKTK